jgi:hypothetical protein
VHDRAFCFFYSKAKELEHPPELSHLKKFKLILARFLAPMALAMSKAIRGWLRSKRQRVVVLAVLVMLAITLIMSFSLPFYGISDSEGPCCVRFVLVVVIGCWPCSYTTSCC